MRVAVAIALCGCATRAVAIHITLVTQSYINMNGPALASTPIPPPVNITLALAPPGEPVCQSLEVGSSRDLGTSSHLLTRLTVKSLAQPLGLNSRTFKPI